MIYVLRETDSYNNGYDVREFNTIEQAIEEIRKDGLPNINGYRFIQGTELIFTLKEKEV